jgi:hypothetical protein
VTEAPLSSSAERHRDLVERLAAELKPVRPLWSVRTRLGLWLLLEALVFAWALAHTSNDFGLKLHAPAYALEVILFAGAAILSALLALRAAIPGRHLGQEEIALAAGLILAGTALLMGQPMRTTYPLSQFIQVGTRCADHTVLFGMPPWIALWWAVRRGAPLRAGLTGLLIGGAAMLSSFALMRLGCPVDERLHLITWHLIPALAMAALSALAGAAWLRFRPRARG